MASCGLQLTKVLPAVLIPLLLWSVAGARAKGMFENRTSVIPQGTSQLNYGVAVTNVADGHGPMEWVVAGFSGANLVLQYNPRTGKYRNIAEEDPRLDALRDPQGAAIGVCACDIDGDGLEEIYFLNTNNRYSGPKLVRDRLFKWRNNRYEDLFSDDVNSNVSSMYSGRSVACVDRTGSGKYGILLATYAQDRQGKFGLIEMNEYHPSNDVQRGRVVLHNIAEAVGIDFSTGGRGIAVGPIIGNDGFSDIYFVNEGNGGLGNRGDNSLFVNDGQGRFTNMADRTNLNDAQPGRGVTLADFNNDGKTDIVYGNWMGPHRLQIQDASSSQPTFFNAATREFATASPIRTVIAADFDNTGTLHVFMNNIVYRGLISPNNLYRILPEGASVGIVREDIGDAEEPKQHGTGAAVADIDQDGVLELLVAHGESQEQGLTFYHVTRSKVEGNKWLRVLPLTQYGAPARGAKVTLSLSDGRRLSRIIDGGSGYLCEMEPVAHFGLGWNSKVRELKVTWPDNHEITKTLRQTDVNKLMEISHTGSLRKIEPASNINTGSYDTKMGTAGRGSAAISQDRRGASQGRRRARPYRTEPRSRSRSRSDYNGRGVDPSTSSRTVSTSPRGTATERRNQRRVPINRRPTTKEEHSQSTRTRHRTRQYNYNMRRENRPERIRANYNRRPTVGPSPPAVSRVKVSAWNNHTSGHHGGKDRLGERIRQRSHSEAERRRQEGREARLEKARMVQRQKELEERRRNAEMDAERRRRRWESARRSQAVNTRRETAPRGATEAMRRWQHPQTRRTTLTTTTEDPRRSWRRVAEERRRATARAEDERKRAATRRRAAENARTAAAAAERDRRRNSYSSRRSYQRERVVTPSTAKPYDVRSREYYRILAQQKREAAARKAEQERRNNFRRAELDRRSRSRDEVGRKGDPEYERNIVSRRRETTRKRSHEPRYRPRPQRVTARPEITTRETTASHKAYDEARRHWEARHREGYSRRRVTLRPTPDTRESNWVRRMDSRRRYTPKTSTTTQWPTRRSYSSVDRRRNYARRYRPERYRSTSYKSREPSAGKFKASHHQGRETTTPATPVPWPKVTWSPRYTGSHRYRSRSSTHTAGESHRSRSGSSSSYLARPDTPAFHGYANMRQA